MHKYLRMNGSYANVTSGREARRAIGTLLARISWGCSVALFAITIALLRVSRHPATDSAFPIITLLIIFLAFSTVGMMIAVHQPTNLIAWVFSAAGLTYIGVGCARTYALDALAAAPGTMPGATTSAWVAAWLTIPPVFLITTFIPLLFPTGTVPSPVWRMLAKLAIGAMILTTLEVAFSPGHLPNPGFTSIDNPFGLHGTPGAVLNAAGFVLLLLPICGLLATISLFLRLHRSTGTERRQLKLFFTAAALIAASFLLAVVVALTDHSMYMTLDVARLTFAGIPIAAGVAILRHRLWNIDAIIDRSLLYGSLTVSIVVLNVLVVGGVGTFLLPRQSLLLSVVATGIAAVLFQPLRTYLQRVIARIIYGERDDPYAVISRLGSRLEETLAIDAVLPTIAETITRALKLRSAAILLIDGDLIRLGAAHGWATAIPEIQDPDAIAILRDGSSQRAEGLSVDSFDSGSAFHRVLGQFNVALIVPLAHRGALVGALCLSTRGTGEPFAPADYRLVRGLASQAGSAVEAVSLNSRLRVSLEEVHRSRELLMIAQEEERRRIQRDLHDGLGPVLAGIRLRLEACLDQAEEEVPSLVESLERLYELVDQASTDIRRLVYELRPPILDRVGLVEALREHIDRLRHDTYLDINFVRDSNIEIEERMEVPLFRIAQEALVNVQKHAGARHVTVRLAQSDDSVVLEVEDDGVGPSFDSGRRQSGTGLENMRLRAELLSGTIRVTGGVTSGTHVTVRLPTTTKGIGEVA